MIVILVASYAPNAFIPLTNPLQYKTETFGENYQVSGTTDKQTARKNVYLSKKIHCSGEFSDSTTTFSQMGIQSNGEI